ncbi:hypothetical protein ABTM97_19220, partial [Acinetobacter baumannii]
QIVAGKPATSDFQDYDPLFTDVLAKKGPSVLVRQLARMHEAPKYYEKVLQWLGEIDLHGSFYQTPVDPVSARGYGGTEAARGALQDWIVIEDG